MFEWDEDKNASNLEKHGFRFEDAISVFDDQYALEVSDEIHPERFIRIGFSIYQGLIVVVYCETDKSKLRLISARKANKQEQKTYAQTLRFF